MLAAWDAHDSATVLDVMSEVASSAGAWFGFDRADQLRMGALAIGAPVLTLTHHDLLGISRRPNDETGGLPVWRVTSSHTLNRTVQTAFATGVSAANQAAYSRQWLQAEASNAAIKNKHFAAREMATETAFSDPAGSANNAAAELGQYAPGREWLEVSARISPALLTAVDIGKTITVQVPRFGYDSGKAFLIIGLRTDYRRGVVEMTLWG